MQLPEAMEVELAAVQADLGVFERAIAENPELESALADLDEIED